MWVCWGSFTVHSLLPHRNQVGLLCSSSSTKRWPQSTLIVQCLTWAKLVLRVISGLVHSSMRQRTCCTDAASLETRACLFFSLPVKGSREQPCGPSPRSSSSSAVSDLLAVNPRLRAWAGSFCWRASVCSAIPPAPSATGTSCLNALPVESVSQMSCTRTLNTAEITVVFSKGRDELYTSSSFYLPVIYFNSFFFF